MLEGLFAGHVGLRAVIEAAVEGLVGHVTTVGDAARLSVGCYEIFGGAAAAPAARHLVATAARPRELVYGNDPAWRRLILEVHGDGAFDRPMRDFDASGLDRARLLEREAAVPDGFELRPFDERMAGQLGADLEPHALQVYPGVEAFLRDGMGFGLVRQGELACAATSYTRSSRQVEVAIATRPAWRGRGLAAAAAARLLRECLDEGLTPRWSASNPVSQRLAARLGYAPAGTCEVLYLR